ncbi:hypothetical protein AX16_009893 [Volvariella volvacea WC 439]|nr:hypothetical protein AX16_009893 [Volvariella volvacea WC 439]
MRFQNLTFPGTPLQNDAHTVPSADTLPNSTLRSLSSSYFSDRASVLLSPSCSPLRSTEPEQNGDRNIGSLYSISSSVDPIPRFSSRTNLAASTCLSRRSSNASMRRTKTVPPPPLYPPPSVPLPPTPDLSYLLEQLEQLEQLERNSRLRSFLESVSRPASPERGRRRERSSDIPQIRVVPPSESSERGEPILQSVGHVDAAVTQ